MTVRLFHTSERQVDAIEELSRVTLRRALTSDEGQLVPAGASGTVVFVLGQGSAYLVEFVEPFAALVEAQAGDVDPIEGESRADLLAGLVADRAS